MEIINVTDKNSVYIDTCSSWLMDWWGKKEGFSEEKMNVYIKNMINSNEALPQSFILKENDHIAGCFQLSLSDIDIRPDIYPWLANVYIDEKI